MDARSKHKRLTAWFDKQSVWYKANKTLLDIDFYNKAKLAFKSGDNPDAWYGETLNHLVIDEGSRISEAAMIGAVSRLTVTRGQARFLGNRSGDNWFTQFCDDTSNSDIVLKYPASQAVADGIMSAEDYAFWQSQMSELHFAELYELRDIAGASPFAPAIHATADAPQPTNLIPVIYGIDIGKEQDKTAIIGINSAGQVCYQHHFLGVDYTEAVKRIASIVKQVPTRVDATGVGNPVCDMLSKRGIKLLRYTITGGKSKGYSVNRQDLLENVAVLLEQGLISIHRDFTELLTELRQFEIKRVADRTVWRVPEHMHDDIVFALALAVWNYTPGGSRIGRLTGRR